MSANRDHQGERRRRNHFFSCSGQWTSIFQLQLLIPERERIVFSTWRWQFVHKARQIWLNRVYSTCMEVTMMNNWSRACLVSVNVQWPHHLLFPWSFLILEKPRPMLPRKASLLFLSSPFLALALSLSVVTFTYHTLQMSACSPFLWALCCQCFMTYSLFLAHWEHTYLMGVEACFPMA